MKILIVYIPVLHRGYLNLFEKEEPTHVFLISEGIVDFFAKTHDYLSRSFLHALPVEYIQSTLENQQNLSVTVLTVDNMDDFYKALEQLKEDGSEIILPKEDISDYFIENYLSDTDVSIRISDEYFLRWNKHSVMSQRVPNPDEIVEELPFDTSKIVSAGINAASYSADWWRQVGAVLFDEETGDIIFTGHNKHVLYSGLPNIFGDARAPLTPGEIPDWVTAIHAEQMILVLCLRNHVDISSLSLYVTTYPCTVCAKLIGPSGIRKVYYSEGYSKMDEPGEVLKEYGVQVIHVPYEK